MSVDEESMPSMATATSEEDRQLARELVTRARMDGLDLVGPDGVLTGLTKQVLETALEKELTDHLGLASTTRLVITRATAVTAPVPRRC